jgi:hypothetical protein
LAPINEGYVAAALDAQGIACTPQRAARIARTLATDLRALAEDCGALPFDVEAAAFAVALRELPTA